MAMLIDEGFEAAIVDDLTFDAIRGTAQEDVASPLNWDAAFAILLSALDTVEQGKFYTQNCHYVNLRVRENCYADDLVTICSSLIRLQARADSAQSLGSYSPQRSSGHLRSTGGTCQ
jgi:hypothetical protein